ncbi:MAG: hypothetical protein HQM03_20965 [Magnetococcales bacterium]|nr:hypothetical protein [Magnetococcales bacterium]
MSKKKNAALAQPFPRKDCFERPRVTREVLRGYGELRRASDRLAELFPTSECLKAANQKLLEAQGAMLTAYMDELTGMMGGG